MGAAAVEAARERRLHRRGHGGVHRLGGDRPRGVLLHGDEHPAPGRAPGHRAGLRPGPGGTGSCGWRRASGCRGRRRAARAATRSRPGSTPRIRPRVSCRPAAASSLSSWPDVCGSTRASSAGSVVGSDYDPMLAKVIAHGAGRWAGALRTSIAPCPPRRCSAWSRTSGSPASYSPIPSGPDGWTPGWSAAGRRIRRGGALRRAVRRGRGLAGGCALPCGRPPTCGKCRPGGGRPAGPVSVRLRAGERTEHVHIAGSADAAEVRVEDGEPRLLQAGFASDRLAVTLRRAAPRIHGRRLRTARCG